MDGTGRGAAQLAEDTDREDSRLTFRAPLGQECWAPLWSFAGPRAVERIHHELGDVVVLFVTATPCWLQPVRSVSPDHLQTVRQPARAEFQESDEVPLTGTAFCTSDLRNPELPCECPEPVRSRLHI